MICCRCGYCCINYDVVIVKDPSLGINLLNMEYKGSRNKCLHLLGNKPGDYSCAIHSHTWYKETPCFDFGQIERNPNTECRMGRYILKGDKSG